MYCVVKMNEFRILKAFRVDIHPPKAPVIREVIWCPPISNWIKVNTDGAASNVNAASGGIFRDVNGT